MFQNEYFIIYLLSRRLNMYFEKDFPKGNCHILKEISEVNFILTQRNTSMFSSR